MDRLWPSRLQSNVAVYQGVWNVCSEAPKHPPTASAQPGDMSCSPARGQAFGSRVCVGVVVLQGAHPPSCSPRPPAPSALSWNLPSPAPSALTKAWSLETPGSVLGGGHSHQGSIAPKYESASSNVSIRRPGSIPTTGPSGRDQALGPGPHRPSGKGGREGNLGSESRAGPSSPRPLAPRVGGPSSPAPCAA